MPNIKQTDEWPEEFEPQGIVVGRPADLGPKLGITFTKGSDDFDIYYHASGEADGEPFGLLRFERASMDGTGIYGPDGIIEKLGLEKWLADGQPKHKLSPAHQVFVVRGHAIDYAAARAESGRTRVRMLGPKKQGS